MATSRTHDAPRARSTAAATPSLHHAIARTLSDIAGGSAVRTHGATKARPLAATAPTESIAGAARQPAGTPRTGHHTATPARSAPSGAARYTTTAAASAAGARLERAPRNANAASTTSVPRNVASVTTRTVPNGGTNVAGPSETVLSNGAACA